MSFTCVGKKLGCSVVHRTFEAAEKCIKKHDEKIKFLGGKGTNRTIRKVAKIEDDILYVLPEGIAV